MVDQDAAHRHRGDPVEVTPILIVRPFLIDEAEVGSMDEVRGSEGEVGTLATEPAAGNPFQVFVHGGHEALVLECSGTRGKQEIGDLGSGLGSRLAGFAHILRAI